MLVEFVGVPGVGKTTLAKRVENVLGWRTVEMSRWLREHSRLGKVGLFGRVARALTIAEQPALLRVPNLWYPASPIQRMYRNQFLLRSYFLREAEGKNLLIEDGDIMSLCLAAVFGVDAERMAGRLIPKMRMADVLVWVGAERSTIVNRLLDRQGFWGDRREPELLEMIDKYESVLSNFLDNVPVPVIYVRSENYGLQTVEALSDSLVELSQRD